MAVIAGLFGSQVQATQAMDALLKTGYEGLETRVIEGGQESMMGPGPVIPVVPNTGGSGLGQPGSPPLAGAAFADSDWLDPFEEAERVFYYEGLREGATLAMAKVDDKHVDEVRQLMSRHGARTFVED